MFRVTSFGLLLVSLLAVGCGEQASSDQSAKGQNSVQSGPSNMAATNENSTVAALPEGTVAAEPPKGTGVTPDEATICTAAGIKPYPGAKEVKPLETKLDQAGDSRYEYSFTTTDPRKKIGEFYSEFGLSGAAESPKAVLIGKTKSGQDVIVGLQDKDGATQVAIKAIVYKKK